MTAPQIKSQFSSNQFPDPSAPKTSLYYEPKDGTLTAHTTRPINGVLSVFTIQDNKGRRDFGVTVDIYKLAEKFAQAAKTPPKPPSPVTHWNSLFRSLEKYLGEFTDSLPDFLF